MFVSSPAAQECNIFWFFFENQGNQMAYAESWKKPVLVPNLKNHGIKMHGKFHGNLLN